ncbi:MAG: hypothetical protein QXZ71_03240, partial [Candidatus Caldarchaeum sp.]
MGISLSRIFSDLFTQDEDGVPVFGSFVGGSWHVSKDKPSFNVVTPIDGTVVARVQRCGAAEVA